MTLTYERTEEPFEDTLLAYGVVFQELQPQEVSQALALLMEHLEVKLVRTNQTKHGNTELQLREGA